MTVEAHLAALQLGDSMFPAGLYALSYGLEAFVDAFLVGSAAEVESFLAELLARQIGPSDGVAAAWAWRGADAADPALVRAADCRLDAAKLVEAQRDASREGGRRVLDVARACGLGGPVPALAAGVAAGDSPGHHAVAMAVVCRAEGVGLAETVAGELYAVASTVAGAALRLLRIDHLEAQAMLRGVRGVAASLVDEALAAPLEALGGWAPAADAAAMAHQRASRKLFAT